MGWDRQIGVTMVGVIAIVECFRGFLLLLLKPLSLLTASAMPSLVAEAPWSVAEWAVALRFDHPRATVLVLLLG